jgi:hypothetical protein
MIRLPSLIGPLPSIMPKAITQLPSSTLATLKPIRRQRTSIRLKLKVRANSRSKFFVSKIGRRLRCSQFAQLGFDRAGHVGRHARGKACA